MKRLFLILLALVACMSADAQMIKVMKGDEVVAKFRTPQVDRVVYEEAPPTSGTAKRNVDAEGIEKVDVKWVQLWEDGPKFAEYNVGAENNKAEDYGGYYTWGGMYKNGNGIDWVDDHNTGTSDLSGESDTATKLWGNNWRMPTSAEFEALLDKENCTSTWIKNYNETEVKGLLFSGKEGTAFESNSVFFPAAGNISKGTLMNPNNMGVYWSSTPFENSRSYHLNFNVGYKNVDNQSCYYGYSVRAVLKEE